MRHRHLTIEQLKNLNYAEVFFRELESNLRILHTLLITSNNNRRIEDQSQLINQIQDSFSSISELHSYAQQNYPRYGPPDDEHARHHLRIRTTRYNR